MLQTYFINDHIIRINEANENGLNVDSYLILGKQSAVVIDTLQDTTQLYEKIQSLTNLPLTVLLTHGHPDHAGKATQKFIDNDVPVYMHPNDKDLLSSFTDAPWQKQIHALEDGMLFDLGGYTLKTICCAGHTPGSVVFFNEKHSELFTGDAIGSGGFWMQLDHCLPLHTYLENVEHLYDVVKSIPHLKLYFGHSEQAKQVPELQYMEDNITATKMILDKKLVGEWVDMHIGHDTLHVRQACFQQVYEYCYDPNNL